MSTKLEENLVQIDCVDVASISHIKEELVPSETCDSGIETSLAATIASSSIDTLNLEMEGSDKKAEEIIDSENSLSSHNSSVLSSPASNNQEYNDATDTLHSFEDFSVDKINEFIEMNTENDLITIADEDLNFDLFLSENNISETCDNNDNISIDQSYKLHKYNEEKACKVTTNIEPKNLSAEIKNSLTLSTASLNDECKDDSKKLSVSSYSKSAEQLFTIEQMHSETVNLSSQDINTNMILNEFKTQKLKASATQKAVMQDVPQKPNLDAHKVLEATQTADGRLSRIPKEILSQDLGSIVKNVHGIFSSVSGSLMNAYTHRGVQKPQKHVKPVPNGKIMNDIFEDENVDKTNMIGRDLHEKMSPKIDSSPQIEESITHTTKEELEKKSVDREEVEETKIDILWLQIESLERVLGEQRKENSSLKEKVRLLIEEKQGKEQSHRELEARLESMSKRVEQAEREKDAAVMRYASVECAAIEARKATEKAMAAEKAAVAEMELMGGKLKSAHSEKHRICQLYDDKCHELLTSEREVAKVREEMKELEGKLKWTQSKLRMEMDAYKDSAERAEKLEQQLSELEAAKETATANANDSAKAKQLEVDLKESQAALILCRHEKEEIERRLTSVTSQLESWKREKDSASSGLALATAEIEQLKISNLRLEEEAAELAALRAQAALADTLSGQLERERRRGVELEVWLQESRAQLETCAQREAAALEHAASLTSRQVAISHDTTAIHHKAKALEADNASLREKITELEGECKRLGEALEEESDRRNKENRVLARKVAELTEEVGETSKQLEWEKGENNVLKKKHASAIKELNRELQRALKRCEQLESKLTPHENNSTRTGSISSLSSGENAQQEDLSLRLQNGHTNTGVETMPDIQAREPDRQTLIERIVSLQRAAARRSERCEFLEEHSRQLTAELRAKSKLLRNLLCAMPAGAVASSTSDQHKKEIARLGGGAMAAVWGGDPNGMTLELSLEMNKRLQAVLEDALLKNITLKENMDTLGEEIARLKSGASQK